MSDDNNHPEFSDEYEEPEIWDEFQWEEFMKEADKRTEKYAGLFQKYLDHPDRDRIIAIEMGWDHRPEETDADDWMDAFFTDEFEEGEEWKQRTGYEPTEIDTVEHFPVYQKAHRLTLDSIRLVQAQFQDKEDESISAFIASVIIPPAKISGGFVMGFDMESLGGNIANNKRGLTAANRTMTALQELRDKQLIDQKTFRQFYNRAKEVRDELAIYIVELRERFRNRLP